VVLGDLDAGGLARTAADITTAGGVACTVVGDLTQEAAAAQLIQTAVERYERLDILVNNVGGSRTAKIWDMAVEDWDFVLRLNLRSTFLCTRYAVQHMMRQRSGVILAFGGYGDPWPNLGGLQVSFQAVEALRRGLSVELGSHGIRVVTLQTNGIAESISDPDFRAKIEAGIVANTMLERGATLEDVGNAAVFAASDWARTVTASKINITCGGFVD